MRIPLETVSLNQFMSVMEFIKVALLSQGAVITGLSN